jgi:hypothetical protein
MMDRPESRSVPSGQWVVEPEAGLLVLEFERGRSEWSGELALPGVERLEPRPVACGQWVLELEVGWLLLEFQ